MKKPMQKLPSIWAKAELLVSGRIFGKKEGHWDQKHQLKAKNALLKASESSFSPKSHRMRTTDQLFCESIRSKANA